jgi:hypothetical protein
MVHAARSVIHDRLNGMWMLALLAAAGGATALWLGGLSTELVLLALAGALVLLALPARVPLALVRAEAAAFRALLRSPRLAATSLAIHFMTLGAFAALCAALQPNSPLWWQTALVAPAVMLLAAVPVSLGGWGMRESAMIVALGLFGVPASEALAVSVAYGLMLLVTGALAALVWAGVPQNAKACPTRSRASTR